MMLASSFILLSLLVASSNAANDWSTPCFSGSCQYDLPSSNGTASGTVMIWGSAKSISDITPAAGWEIIGCSPDELKQDIRLVCKDGSTTDCAHLFDGTTNAANAVGKVVRLPENCGQNAFAVVTKSFVPQDQSIPSNVASTLARRDGTAPTVRGLSLDTTFSGATPPSGPVNFALRAANVPGANGDLSNVPQQQRRSNSRFMKRGVSDFVNSAVNEISSLNSFNINQSKTLPPVDVDKTFNLLDKSISCPPTSANLKIDVEAKAHAVASIGVAAAGTIVPPSVSSFALIGGLNANLDGSVDMKATATGSLDSGKLKLFEVGIPGLDIPGIISIGPTFQINGQATANLDLSVDMTVGISYTISNAQFVFPPNSQKSSGGFNIGDTPLQLSAGTTAKATGTVVAHVIPSLNFGISALGNTVSANVFLDLDASATMTLNADGSASAAGTVTPRREVAATEVRRGLHLLAPPSLNRRTPQDDGDDGFGDSTDGGQDDSGDGSVDPSQDDSEDGAVDNSQDDSGNDTVDNSQDGSSDGSADSSQDDSSDGSVDDSQDNSGDSSFDDSQDTSGDGSVDDSEDNSDNTDNTDNLSADDGTDGSTDSTTDTSSDSTTPDDGSDNTDSTDTATGVDSSDPSTDDSSDASSANDGTDSTDSSTDNTSGDNTDNTDNTDSASADTATSTSSATDSSPTDTSTADTSSALKPKVALTSATASFGGCFEIDGGLDVSVGADGSFFGLFDKNTQLPLFNKQFQILKKCFGSQAGATRRELSNSLFVRSTASSHLFSAPRLTSLSMMRRGLSCSAGGATLQSIASQTVSASQITQK